ncbi:anoctamin-7 isoform X2 [Ambystoma mexicanum]|uniref:anoctamin-7 isoform X2 n=1 Tax=Ambystoma mexicanum TaxID=8296 RepID=UPI0037E7AB93
MKLRKIVGGSDAAGLIQEEEPSSGSYYGSIENDSHTILMTKLNNNHDEAQQGITDVVHGGEKPMNYFKDGLTPIDFALVYEADLQEEDKVQDENEHHTQKNVHYTWRQKFLKKLKSAGILIEEHTVLKPKKTIHYVLLSAPWDVLCYYAEEMNLRVPLQTMPNQSKNWSAEILKKMQIPNLLHNELPSLPVDLYTCPFKTSKLSLFLGSSNKNTFFSNTQRHQIMHEILSITHYGDVKKGQVGIQRMLNENAFQAAFPLHDGSYDIPSGSTPIHTLTYRQILFRYWAKWGKWNKYQPLDHVRKYFGEKIALYFAWLGFYTGWLLPAAVFGTVIFLFGIILMTRDLPAKEICESEGQFQMCPVCKACPYWNLSSICNTYKAGLLFDHGGTVFFSVFMSLWAVTFLEYWKRTNAVLVYRWDCFEFAYIEERPRPEFAAMAPTTIRNPITGAEEPYFPKRRRINRIITGSMALILMVTVVVMFLIAIILYRSIIRLVVTKYGLVALAPRIASITGSVVNLIIILILSKIYIFLAHFLTQWEMHRTQTAYEDAFTFKVFLFQFVNFYSSPIYIAFFKGRFVGYPGHYSTLFGMRNEECSPGGCLIELAQELLVIMVGKQVINNIQEFIVPKIRGLWQKYKLRTTKEGMDTDAYISSWERDYTLVPCEGLFDEYLEMVIQFGFITIFVAACPLAPLFALINNWVEIRLDAHKFVCEYQRPVVERAQNIGIWFKILEVITYLAIRSNAFLIAFTSDFIPRLYYQHIMESNLKGYVNFTLAYAPQNAAHENNLVCRYLSYRENDGRPSITFWNLLALRLAFVIIFEQSVALVDDNEPENAESGITVTHCNSPMANL